MYKRQEEDRDKSAFITQGGCFRFTVMPFGLTCTPSEFQRLMDVVLCGLSYLTCLVYIDDVIVFASSFDEQLLRLEQVFDRLAKAQLKLKPSKCSLCECSVDFLGHVVSTDGIAMQQAKISAITEWPACKSVADVRAFMGLTGYYRRFVKNFPQLARWLTFIEQFDYEILHRPGTQHGNADGLSRRPVETALPEAQSTPAKVATISYGATSQDSATFNGQKAAAFLYKHLPSIDDIAVGEAEVYCEQTTEFLSPTPDAVHGIADAVVHDAITVHGASRYSYSSYGESCH